MYTYVKYTPLNKEEILKRVSQEEIFQLCFKEPLDFSKFYKAPYREDKNPGCYFNNFKDILYFTDFANVGENPNLDCFSLIQKLYNTDYIQSLRLINSKLKLNLGFTREIVKEEKYNYILKKEEKNRPKRNRSILLSKRDFNLKDKKYWFKYGISKQNLIDDLVTPIRAFKAYSRANAPFSKTSYTPMYAYTGFYNLEGELKDKKIKIYNPLTKNKKEKWFTNCNQDDVGFLEKIPIKGDILVITKSYKDARIILNEGINVVWFQNEGIFPNNEILQNVISRFKKIYIIFDNDNTGVGASIALLKIINSLSTINTQVISVYKSKNITDIAELYLYNKKEFKNLIERIKN